MIQIGMKVSILLRNILLLVSTNDAVELMYDCKREKRTFDIVDLDPYGSSLPFLENALNIVEHGGLLCSTFTDMRVLCA